MATGERARPARVLVVAAGPDLDRLLGALRREGHVVELAAAADAAARIATSPPVTVVVLDAVDDAARAAILDAADAARAWCVHVARDGAAPLLPAHRARMVVALRAESDEAHVASTIRTLLGARRASRR